MMKNNRNNMDHNDRALKLCHAVVMSFNDRKGIGISKYDERKKHNEKIRAEAGRNDLPWEASPVFVK